MTDLLTYTVYWINESALFNSYTDLYTSLLGYTLTIGENINRNTAVLQWDTWRNHFDAELSKPGDDKQRWFKFRLSSIQETPLKV